MVSNPFNDNKIMQAQQDVFGFDLDSYIISSQSLGTIIVNAVDCPMVFSIKTVIPSKAFANVCDLS